MKRAIQVTLAMIVFTTLAVGESSLLMNFKGRLTNSNGDPVTAPTPAVFTICQDGSLSNSSPCGGGSIVYSETATVLPQSDGTFDYIIGTGTALTPPGLTLPIFDTTRALCLEVVINGELILPRQLLTLNQVVGRSNSLMLESAANTSAIGTITAQG